MLNGFADPDQPELVNPYREKYFAVAGDVWRNWSSAMAQDFVSGAYTVGAISEETVRTTDEYIDGHRPAGGAAPAAARGPRRRAPGAALPGAGPAGALIDQCSSQTRTQGMSVFSSIQ